MFNRIINSKMFWPTIIMGVLAIALFIIATIQGEGKNVAGLKNAWVMTRQIIPLLAFAFIMAGLVQVMLPKDLLAECFDFSTFGRYFGKFYQQVL